MQATQSQILPTGTIRISAPLAFGFHYLTSLTTEFLKQYDQVKFVIILENRRVNMVEEAVDIAFRISPLADSGLIARELGEASHILCAAPDYLEKHGTPKILDDLKHHKCIQCIPWEFLGEQGIITYVPEMTVAVNDLGLARQLILKGLGITMMSNLVCAEDIESGKLCEIQLDVPPVKRKVYLLYPDNRHLSTKVRTFIDFIFNTHGFTSLLQ